jgi:zinc finger protein
VADLLSDQPVRKIMDEESYAKIQVVVDGLKEIVGDDEDEDGTVRKPDGHGDEELPMKPFTIKLDDPAGNSFIEFVGSMADPKWNMRTYARTREQNIEIGLAMPDDQIEVKGQEQSGVGTGGRQMQIKESATDIEEIGPPEAPEGDGEEIYVFPGVCSSCGRPLDTLMKRVIIPYFKVRFCLDIMSYHHLKSNLIGRLNNVDKLYFLWIPR